MLGAGKTKHSYTVRKEVQLEYQDLPAGLRAYIDQIRLEPYRVPTNTCIRKNLKVARKAQAMGCNSILMFCFAQTPRWMRWIYPYNPHLYLLISGVKVDMFYAHWWRTDRLTRCHVKVCDFKAK